MPIAEFESIISVSSEDPSHPAKNLLTSAIGNNVKKWKCCKKGDKNASVVFKFKEKTRISHISVGNENTAIIEVLAGNENMQENEFQVLLPTTELQTIQDVRAGRNVNSMHFFTIKDFKSDVAGRLWERLKVVCNQPYDSHISFGLSCFVVKSIKDEKEEAEENESNKQVTKEVKSEKKQVDVKDEKTDLDVWKEDMLQRLNPVASTSSSPLLKNDSDSDSKHKNRKRDHNGSMEASSAKKIKNAKVENKVKQPNPPKKDFSKIMEDVRFSMSGYENPLRSELRNKALEMGAKYAADWDNRCTHLICAFLNTPKFNQVKSSRQGKIVVKDWIDECYSKRRRLPWRRFALDVRERKLPISEEDEDDEQGKANQSTKNPNVDRRRRLPSASSSDTEDEIERVRARKVGIFVNKDSPKKLRVNNTKKTIAELYNADTDESAESDLNDTGIFDDDTDKDEDYKPDGSFSPRSSGSLTPDALCSSPDSSTEAFSGSESDEMNSRKKKKKKNIKQTKKNKVVGKKRVNLKKQQNHGKRPDTSDIPLPHLPDFPSRNYYIAKDEKDDYRNHLERYIHAFNGNICEKLSDEVEFAITDDLEIAKEILSQFPDIKTIKSDWIWKCNDSDSLISYDEFLLK